MKNYLLPLLSVCLLLLVLIAIPGKDTFKLSASDIRDRIYSFEYKISPDQLNNPEGLEGKVLVDLRNQDIFMKSHLPGAVNLPVEEMNVKSIREFFSESGNYILYAEETYIASQVWILITQMGIENVFVLETGPVPNI